MQTNNPLKAVDLDNKKIVYDGCMLTKSNILIDLYHPDPDLILIDDIAHGLANNCRWNGHTQRFWSVAQHCCMMCDMASPKDKLKYLFHDAEEAYWGDTIKPLKNKIKESCPEIILLMREMRKIIYDKFKIDYIDEGTEKADFECLQWEFENIIKNSNADYWMPERAKAEWLDRYYKAIFKQKI